ncbi:MAG: mycothiol synthase [Acidimicrobiales bacterium]|jgi:mycothiol synthase|nr:mycothiol synthase [Acidimicrobiales bacterium]
MAGLRVTTQPDTHPVIDELTVRLAVLDADRLRLEGGDLLTSVLERARELEIHDVVLDAEPATDIHDELASSCGFELDRELLQLRRRLPVGRSWTLDTRPFEPGRDEAAWLTVNNRAFHWHPDQAGWREEQLREREAEPWFDRRGFLLHERDGRLAGFCWTKVHAETDPPMGEIYVVAVDPDFQGLGLGRRLVLAGLDHLAGLGLGVGMLYVEADNVEALALYDELGFELHHRHRWYRRRLRPPGT